MELAQKIEAIANKLPNNLMSKLWQENIKMNEILDYHVIFFFYCNLEK